MLDAATDDPAPPCRLGIVVGRVVGGEEVGIVARCVLDSSVRKARRCIDQGVVNRQAEAAAQCSQVVHAVRRRWVEIVECSIGVDEARLVGEPGDVSFKPPVVNLFYLVTFGEALISSSI